MRSTQHFARHAGGATALMFGLALLPILGAASAAVDYARASAARTRLLVAADAAALAAVAGRLPPEDEDACSDAADRAFRAQPNLPVTSGLKVRCKMSKKDGSVSVRVTFSSAVETTLGRAVGWREVSVGGAAEAQRGRPSAIDFHLLLDTSPSMGIAATVAEQARLSSLTGGCVFACHTTEAGGGANWAVARKNNVYLRVDALRDAVKALIDAARAAPNPEAYRVALHTFTATMSTFLPLTGNLAAARASLDWLDLTPINDTGTGLTWFVTPLSQLRSVVGASGSGDKSDPRKILLIVTDGQADDPSRNRINSYAMDPALCAPYKTAGVTVATVHVRAAPNAAVDSQVSPEAVAAGLRDCASTGMYFVADTPEEIRAAFAALFKALAPIQLTR